MRARIVSKNQCGLKRAPNRASKSSKEPSRRILQEEIGTTLPRHPESSTRNPHLQSPSAELPKLPFLPHRPESQGELKCAPIGASKSSKEASRRFQHDGIEIAPHTCRIRSWKLTTQTHSTRGVLQIGPDERKGSRQPVKRHSTRGAFTVEASWRTQSRQHRTVVRQRWRIAGSWSLLSRSVIGGRWTFLIARFYRGLLFAVRNEGRPLPWIPTPWAPMPWVPVPWLQWMCYGTVKRVAHGFDVFSVLVLEVDEHIERLPVTGAL